MPPHFDRYLRFAHGARNLRGLHRPRGASSASTKSGATSPGHRNSASAGLRLWQMRYASAVKFELGITVSVGAS